MNKEILIIINCYESNNITEALKRVEEVFSNIIINNKSSKIDNLDNFLVYNNITLSNISDYIKTNKLDIKSIVFVDDIINTTTTDIAKCAMDSINNKTSIVAGINDDYRFGEKSINKLFNTVFNTNFKSVIPDIKAISIELFNNLIINIDNSNNYLITALSLNIPIKENNIKTIWRKKESRVGKANFNALSYLKELLPYTIKSLLPYLITLMLFIIIFYLNNSSNDLNGIIIATSISEIIGLIIHIVINYKMVYKNNYLYKNILFILKKIFRIILSCFFVYILYNLLNLNLILSKILVDIILMFIIAYIFNLIFSK